MARIRTVRGNNTDRIQEKYLTSKSSWGRKTYCNAYRTPQRRERRRVVVSMNQFAIKVEKVERDLRRSQSYLAIDPEANRGLRP